MSTILKTFIISQKRFNSAQYFIFIFLFILESNIESSSKGVVECLYSLLFCPENDTALFRQRTKNVGNVPSTIVVTY